MNAQRKIAKAGKTPFSDYKSAALPTELYRRLLCRNGGIQPFLARIFTVIFYGGGMKADATVKTWEKIRLQNLVRHKSGRYYARLFLNGKEIWKSLETSHFCVDEAKLSRCRVR